MQAPTSTIETNTRWSDYLAERLIDSHRSSGKMPPAVSNSGIGGNKVVTDNAAAVFGVSLVNRFERDVLTRSGVTDLIVLEGVNDIGQSTTFTETAENIIAGYRTLIARARAAGLRIYFGTMHPNSTGFQVMANAIHLGWYP